MKKTCNWMKKVMACLLITAMIVSCAPVALAETFSAIVTASSMSVYKKASLSTKLGTLKKGTVVLVTDYSGSVAKIKYQGKTGYAKISAMDAVEDVAEKAIVNAKAKVYKSAKTSSKSVSVKKGTEVYVLATSGNWAQVEKDGNVGYMYLKYLTIVDDFDQPIATATPAPTQTPAATAEITVSVFDAQATKDVKVYKSASTASTCLGTLKKGEVVTVGAYNTDGWAYIRLNGKYGYCQYAALTPVDKVQPTQTATQAPTATPSLKDTIDATVTVDSLAVYKSASTSSTCLGHIYKGETVNVIEWNDTWAYIEMDGKYGFCKISGLTKTSNLTTTPVLTATPAPTATTAPTATPSLKDAIDATVTVDSLAVYKSASTSSTCLGHIYKGETVNVIEWNDTWAYIEMDGKYGYCKISGLTKTSDIVTTPAPTATPSLESAIPATVTTDKLAVYKTASTSSTRLGHIYKGEEVNVIQWNSTWAYIEKGGKYGFCKVSGLTKTNDIVATPAPTATPSLESAIPATVTVDSLAVYKTASTASTKLGTLKKGQEVNVLSWNDDWAYIERNGSYGFCKVSGLTKNSELNKLPDGFSEGGFTATVVSSDARVYASASTSAASSALTLGQSVNVYAYSTSWACIVQGDQYGFVPVKYLSKASYATINASGDGLNTLLKALLAYGYYDAVPSTNYNTAAITAIKRFQSDCGLTQTGEADQVMQRILYSGYAPTSAILSKELSKGDTGTNVGRLQTRLYALGYLSKTSSVDSDYGTTTANAVKLFQSTNGISATGTASVATLKALYSTSAKSLPSSGKPADASGSSSGGSSSGSSYTTTMPASLASFTTSYSSSSSKAEKLEYVIYNAQNQLGKPYVYGAAGPDKYDCSGFTLYCFKKIGITLKRSAYSQGYDNTYEKISSPSDLQRGDLVFFNTISDSDLSDHAGIYLGSGYFIHASSGGAKVVVSNLNSGYYSRVFSWGRRVL